MTLPECCQGPLGSWGCPNHGHDNRRQLDRLEADRLKGHTPHDDWWCECGHPYPLGEGPTVMRLRPEERIVTRRADGSLVWCCPCDPDEACAVCRCHRMSA